MKQSPWNRDADTEALVEHAQHPVHKGEELRHLLAAVERIKQRSREKLVTYATLALAAFFIMFLKF